eukprot:4209179-Pyramimonas_sp.AAC.1
MSMSLQQGSPSTQSRSWMQKAKKFIALRAPQKPDLSSIRDLFNRIREVADDNPLPSIIPTMILDACGRMKASPGLGAD